MDQHSCRALSVPLPEPAAAIQRSVAILSSSLDSILLDGVGIASSIEDCYVRLTRVQALMTECRDSGDGAVASTAQLLEPLVSGLIELTEIVAQGAVAELARSAEELKRGLATIKTAVECAPAASSSSNAAADGSCAPVSPSALATTVVASPSLH